MAFSVILCNESENIYCSKTGIRTGFYQPVSQLTNQFQEIIYKPIFRESIFLYYFKKNISKKKIVYF